MPKDAITTQQNGNNGLFEHFDALWLHKADGGGGGAATGQSSYLL